MKYSVKSSLIYKKAPLLVSCLETIPVTDAFDVFSSGKYWPAIKLKDGIILISELPSPQEIYLFSSIIQEVVGLKTKYIKACIDWATRYLYSHIAVGCDYIGFNMNIRKHAFFHPQHHNLAQECSTFSETLKNNILNEFTPEVGWKVLDVGAYLGHGSLWASQKIGNKGYVLSVEALEEHSKIIAYHRDLNRLTNWDVSTYAVTEFSGDIVYMNRNKRQANALDSEVVDGKDKRKVDTVSIPDLCKVLNGEVDLLSMTINGAEVEAVKGMQYMSEENKPKRIIVPGWYSKEGKLRADIIEPMLKHIKYNTARTPGGLIFAWL